MSASVASPETAKKQREEDAQALKRAMDAVANPTRVEATTADDGDDGDDDEGRERRGERGRGGRRRRRRRRRRRTETERPQQTATDEDYARLDAYLSTGFGLVHADGKDGEGRTVVTVNATRIPGWAGSADRDNSMNLIINTLERVAAAGEYVVVVYFGDDDRSKGVVPTHSLNWLGDLHDKLAYAVRKNVQRIVFVNATWIMSSIISLSMTFASSKASKKFAWTKSLDDMDKDTGYQRPPSDVRRKVSRLGRQKSRVRRTRSRRARARRIVVNSSRISIERDSWRVSFHMNVNGGIVLSYSITYVKGGYYFFTAFNTAEKSSSSHPSRLARLYNSFAAAATGISWASSSANAMANRISFCWCLSGNAGANFPAFIDGPFRANIGDAMAPKEIT